MSRILVTGGSGFIGTNVVESFMRGGHAVLSIDIKKPASARHKPVFQKVDIMDCADLNRIFAAFAPTHVLHLAARTDLHEKKNLRGYKVNIEGVENMVDAICQQPSVERSIFASTKLVCPIDRAPTSDDDYSPETMYGASKVEGEKIVKNSSTMQCIWCIVRPTSIWGPWSTLPSTSYGRFFRTVAGGRYFHPGRRNPLKSFGYIGNTVFQIEKLITASAEQIHRRVFYLSDYDAFTLRDWADCIALALHNRKLHTMPDWLVAIFARIGDTMKLCGVKDPVLSSFRLRNMQTDTTLIPLEPIRSVTGPLPYTMEQGVEETIAWLRRHNFIK